MNCSSFRALISCLCLLPALTLSAQSTTVIKTSRGYVRGAVEKDVTVFKGIPYAAPPVGALRFKAPVETPAWKDTLSCTSFGAPAAQYNGENQGVRGDENCLTLNLYTPDVLPAKKMPVVVWVHGGGMTGGSGMGMNGHAFADKDSIICITINYRLGVFGFLYMGDIPGYETSGNNGLQDCMMALQWIRKNIRAFGGDPSRVSVMGESAGAKLISALLVAPAAKGSFRQLILESGSVNCIRDIATAKAIRQRLMDTLGISDPAALLQLPATTLIPAQAKILGGPKGTNYFGPVTDGLVIKEDALAYVKKHPKKKVRVLLGTNKAEAILFMNMDRRLYTPDSASLSDWFGDNYKYSYAAWKRIQDRPKDTAAIITLSRYMYQLHTFRLAKALAAASRNVWLYSFQQPKNGAPATHADELAYIWYIPGEGHPPANPALATLMHQQWCDFIKGRQLWPHYDAAKTGMVFGENSHVTTPDDYEDPEHPTMGFILHGK
ncbi:carboxylesterase/lipase family protein [Chitinophaga pinensis]|uniref:Carboxylic ester hydrolase n=1 Tax=Chitinophaga pinensis (strain ATCC 43595 / DSM 2588 / LMG 13176 / NBRC 15968 / NCIMB 11800 / UQM 2034) TaxID=485918 RepID=A0A979G775_CHIPD|nr:carboxylesterase family protein [Chitinophaga pinensis]ACU61977.1 Carboxylesterase [Chitinophaga pinensis DSM 2588]